MGSCVSKIEKQEMVTRSRARKHYMKHFLNSRNSLSVSHSFYLRSLRSTGAALLHFAAAESSLHHRATHIAPPAPMPPPPLSPAPMPPPPLSPAPSWDYWDSDGGRTRAGAGEEWEETRVAESELAVVVARQGKEFVDIVKELDEYFVRASDAASSVSAFLEVPSFSSSGKVYDIERSLRLGDECGMVVAKMEMINVNTNNNNNIININDGSHSATLERLYAWEKKFFHEVKNAEKLRLEHEKRVEQLRRLEVKRGDYLKIEKSKKEVDKLESLLEVASQGIQSTSNEIIKLRENELYPQLIDLIKRFMCMWRSMYECHQVQMHIVDQLKFLNAIPSNEPTTEIHRQSTLQLEAKLQQWHQSFINLIKSQRDYIHSLTGWLRLSLFQFTKNPLMRSIQDSTIYSLCEHWQLQIDHVPDKVASEGIKSLLTVVHAIVLQQAEEHKQKKKSETANKDLEKRALELRSLEEKYGPYSMPEMSGMARKSKDPVGDKRAKVEFLKPRAQEEKAKHEKAVSVTRAMTLNNMQMGLPHVFQAITGFSSVCTQGYEKVYNKAKNSDQVESDVKRLMA